MRKMPIDRVVSMYHVHRRGGNKVREFRMARRREDLRTGPDRER